MFPIIESLRWRYATKTFDASKKLSEDQKDALLESLRLSPSSFGLQPWKFLVVESPAVREQIKAVAWNQTQVTDASLLVVLCAKDEVSEADIDTYIQDIVHARGVSAEMLQGYRDMMVGAIAAKQGDSIKQWATKQVYIAAGIAMATAAELRIDACPMEGFDPVSVADILREHLEGYSPVLLLPFGFRSEQDGYAGLAKVRKSKEQVVTLV